MEAISFITVFLLVFAGISLVVGSFLIVNTFSILVAQRTRELALLRALGASRRQVNGSVLLEAGVLGGLGATLGLGLGMLLAVGIRALFARLGLDLSGQELVFEPRTVVVSYAVGILVTVLAAALPARRAGRITPVEAMSEDVAMPESSLRRRTVAGTVLIAVGGAAVGAGVLADVPRPTWWVELGVLATLLGAVAMAPVLSRPFIGSLRVAYRSVFGLTGRLAGDNALRNPRRTAATASALMVGLALVTTMAVLGSSAKVSVDRALEEKFAGDLVVSDVTGSGMSPTIADEVEAVAGVDAVTRVRYGIGALDGQNQGLAAVDPETLAETLSLEMVEGARADLRDGSVLVAADWAEEQALSVGDTLTYQMPAGTKEYDVTGVYEESPVLPYPLLTTLGTLESAGFEPADSLLVVTAEPGVSSASVQDEVAQRTADLPTVSVQDQGAFAESRRAPIDSLLTIVYALLGLALVIAVLGIVNTLALSVIERTREVGLLRAVGLERRQLRRAVRLEAAAISLFGGVRGAALGVGFGSVLAYAMREEGLEVISLPWGQIGAFVVASAVVGVAAAALPARRAAKLDVLRAIATH